MGCRFWNNFHDDGASDRFMIIEFCQWVTEPMRGFAPVSMTSRPCYLGPGPLHAGHSISRCALLNAPAGPFPKTSTS